MNNITKLQLEGELQDIDRQISILFRQIEDLTGQIETRRKTKKALLDRRGAILRELDDPFLG